MTSVSDALATSTRQNNSISSSRQRPAPCRIQQLVEAARPQFSVIDAHEPTRVATGVVNIGEILLRATLALDSEHETVRLDVCFSILPTMESWCHWVASSLTAAPTLVQAWVDREDKVVWIRTISTYCNDAPKVAQSIASAMGKALSRSDVRTIVAASSAYEAQAYCRKHGGQ